MLCSSNLGAQALTTSLIFAFRQMMLTELNDLQCQELRGGNWKNDINMTPIGSPTTTYDHNDATKSEKGNRWTVSYETTQMYSTYIVNPGGQRYQNLGDKEVIISSGTTTMNNGQFKKLAG